MFFFFFIFARNFIKTNLSKKYSFQSFFKTKTGKMNEIEEKVRKIIDSKCEFDR